MYTLDRGYAAIILYMCPANETYHYNVTLSFIGWAHIQNDPLTGIILHMCPVNETRCYNVNRVRSWNNGMRCMSFYIIFYWAHIQNDPCYVMGWWLCMFESHWRHTIFGGGNGLMLSGNKPFSSPLLHMASPGHIQLITVHFSSSPDVVIALSVSCRCRVMHWVDGSQHSRSVCITWWLLTEWWWQEEGTPTLAGLPWWPLHKVKD